MLKYIVVLLFSLFLISNSQTSNEPLKIGYSESPPFIFQNEKGELDGISIWLWQRIADDLEINYQMQPLALDQIISGLENGGIDMRINPLTITAERSQVMDFSQPFYTSYSTIVIKQSSSWQKGLLFISSFFSVNFFKTVGALFLVILIFGFLVWAFEKRKNPDHFETGLKGIWSGIWWSAVTMTTVGYGDKSPQTLGGRIVGLIWMFTAIIIISGFTASIASSLTVNQLSWSNNRIEDFKEKSIASVENSATSAWLDKHFYKKKQDYTNVQQCLEALQVNKVSGVAYDDPILKYLIKNQDNYIDLEILPIKYNAQYYAMGFTFSFNNELRRKISKKIIQISEESDWNLLLTEYNLSEL